MGFIVAGPVFLLSAGTDALPAALAGLVVYGIARGFFDANNMPILRQTADERLSATGYGLLNFASTTAGGAMILAGGMIKDAGMDLEAVFEVSAAGVVLAGALLLVVSRRAR